MTFLQCTKIKVRQTCFKLKEQYSEVVNHNSLTKDDLARVLIPDDFHEIQILLALEYWKQKFLVQFNIYTYMWYTYMWYFCVY